MVNIYRFMCVYFIVPSVYNIVILLYVDIKTLLICTCIYYMYCIFMQTKFLPTMPDDYLVEAMNVMDMQGAYRGRSDMRGKFFGELWTLYIYWLLATIKPL